VQGSDAGGYQFAKGSGIVSLAPEIVDMLEPEGFEEKMDILIVGGIVDGRGFASVLALSILRNFKDDIVRKRGTGCGYGYEACGNEGVPDPKKCKVSYDYYGRRCYFYCQKSFSPPSCQMLGRSNKSRSTIHHNVQGPNP